MQELLDGEDSPSLSSDEASEALMLALHCGHRDIVDLLLQYGSIVDDYRVGAVLTCAAKAGHIEVVELLLDRGAQLNAVDEGGMTALHGASFNAHRDVVKLLLDRGAQISAIDKEGLTALHWASLNGHREVAELLVGRMMVRPTDEQVTRAREHIRTILLWEKLGHKVGAHRLPKDIISQMLLLDERLCRDLAIILLRKCDRGSRIDSTSYLANNKVLLCASQMILAAHGALLDNVYKKLPGNKELKSWLSPVDREKNLSGCILEALTKKIQSSQGHAA